MKNVLTALQFISSGLLIVLVLLQVRGTGFGRSSNSNSFTRRGLEKLIFKSTFVVSAIFIIVSAISLFV